MCYIIALKRMKIELPLCTRIIMVYRVANIAVLRCIFMLLPTLHIMITN